MKSQQWQDHSCADTSDMFIYPCVWFSDAPVPLTLFFFPLYPVNLCSLTSRLECWQSSTACSTVPLAIYKSYFSSEMSFLCCFFLALCISNDMGKIIFCESLAHSLVFEWLFAKVLESERTCRQPWTRDCGLSLSLFFFNMWTYCFLTLFRSGVIHMLHLHWQTWHLLACENKMVGSHSFFAEQWAYSEWHLDQYRVYTSPCQKHFLRPLREFWGGISL